MALTFILLLVASVTLVGLLALWAASSQHHWFWRAATLTLLFVLLSQLRSGAPLALFAIQIATIGVPILAIRIWRARSERRDVEASASIDKDRRSARWRFKTSDILLATLILAGLASTYSPLAAAREEIDYVPWTFAATGGLAFGCIALLAKRSMRSRRSLILATGASLPIAAAVGYGFELRDPGILEYVLAIQSGDEFLTRDWQAWAVISFGVWWGAVANAVVLDRTSGRPERTFWRCSAAVWILLLLLLPGYVYYRLMTPTPIPQVALPSPNGYDDIIAAGKGLDVRLISNAHDSPIDQVAAEVERLDEHYILAEKGLNRPCQAPLDYQGLTSNDFGACRTMARAYSARIRCAVAAGRVDDAVRDMGLALKTSVACRRGGASIDYLVGGAMEGITTADVWEVRSKLDRRQCAEVIRLLEQHAGSGEPTSVVLARDRIQSEHAYGIYGQIIVAISEVYGETWIDHSLRTNIEPRYRTVIELLKCELAIRAFQLEHDALPDSLEALVPELLPAVPTDPFDSSKRPLRYRTTDEGYELYSVGFNGVDDDGIVIRDEEGVISFSRGDYRLDAVYEEGD